MKKILVKLVHKENIVDDWFWKNIPEDTILEGGNYYDIIYGLKRIGTIYIIDLGPYLEVVWGFSRFIFLSCTLKRICSEILCIYPEAQKITTYLIDKDKYGLYLFHKGGFTKEVTLYRYAKFEETYFDAFIMSYYK